MENSVLFAAFCLLLTFADVMTNQPNVANCPKIYQRFSTSHTYCQPQNKACHIKQRKVSQQDADKIVELHNKYRSTIATQGQGSNGLPPASNMMYIEWDQELANIAQKQCDRCLYAHDQNDERRVRNFGVGQNIARQEGSGTGAPQPDWDWAIGAFYGEIKNFHKSQICGSRENIPEEREIGHFTQVVWAKSFRVGCGYTMYKEGDTYIRLYSCNYGPAGNSDGACVYKEGKACSQCPGNTACTKDSKHPGLCQRTGSGAPYTPVTVPTLFNCNFREPNSEDCKIYSEGVSSWSLIPALGGQFLETTLQPGQNATIVFAKKLTGTNGAKKICVQATYRKGPELAKNAQNNKGKAIFIIPSSNDYTVAFDFPNYDGNYRQQFSAYKMTLGWADTTEMKVSFAVPRGATPQFFDLESVIGFNNKCPNLD